MVNAVITSDARAWKFKPGQQQHSRCVIIWDNVSFHPLCFGLHLVQSLSQVHKAFSHIFPISQYDFRHSKVYY